MGTFNKMIRIIVVMTFLIGILASCDSAENTGSIVHAVLFFSETCAQCHVVIEDLLPPLVEKFPDQLVFIGIDVNKQLGQKLFEAMITKFRIPVDRTGIPTLIIDETPLIGTREISQKLPGIIREGLIAGGIGWPDIPGLEKVIEASLELTEPFEEAEREIVQNPFSPETPAFVIRFADDLLANHIAVLVLLGMIACVLIVGYNFIKGSVSGFLRWPKWATPILAGIGLGVALYLSYVEYSQANAICGPVGNCNTVQKSPYAHLFGFLPVGVLGVIGYLLILLSWILQEFGPQHWRKYSSLSAWGLSWFGVFFSIYLTFLEPFVIGATCAWCISSAIIITLILLATTGPAMQAMRIQEEDLLIDGKTEVEEEITPEDE